MINPEDVPPVDSEETLARYIMYKNHIREDKSIRQDAFIPYPNNILSVTRHRETVGNEIWKVGQKVASVRKRTLYGRGDLLASICLQEKLRVIANPIQGNPNHADISDWPTDKPAQKAIAQALSARATLVLPFT